MHVPMLCDWFSSSASACDFDNGVIMSRGRGRGRGRVWAGAVVEVYLFLKNAVLGLG